MNEVDRQIINEIRRMSGEISQLGDRNLYEANRFWTSLSAKHLQLITDYGFANFKRTINFEYHQWGVNSRSDPKIRSLIRELTWRPHRLLAALLSAQVLTSDTSYIRWPDTLDSKTGSTVRNSEERPIPRAYAFYVGLLWQYALGVDRLSCLSTCCEPTIGNPLPVVYKRRLISQDLATSAVELNLIARYIDLKRVRAWAEIGAGYGRLAYVVTTICPDIEYSIFDIPPAAAISKAYLQQTRRPRVTVSLPHRLEHVPDKYFDVFVNISSFDEMSPHQVENYLLLIDKKCSGVLYLKGHSHSRSLGARLGLRQFPIPIHWRLLHSAIDPTCPAFTEQVYALS